MSDCIRDDDDTAGAHGAGGDPKSYFGRGTYQFPCPCFLQAGCALYSLFLRTHFSVRMKRYAFLRLASSKTVHNCAAAWPSKKDQTIVETIADLGLNCVVPPHGAPRHCQLNSTCLHPSEGNTGSYKFEWPKTPATSARAANIVNELRNVWSSQGQ